MKVGDRLEETRDFAKIGVDINLLKKGLSESSRVGLHLLRLA